MLRRPIETTRLPRHLNQRVINSSWYLPERELYESLFVVLLLVASTPAWIAFGGMHFNAIGQEQTPALPMVSTAPVPLYPPLARQTNTQGIIHVKIQTDGQKVVQTGVEETNKLLSTAAKENAKIWEF